MATALQIPGSIKTTNPVPVELTKGPWTSIEQANQNIPQSIRYQGLQTIIIGDGKANVYIYKNGISDSDLVLDQTPTSFKLVTSTNGVLNVGDGTEKTFLFEDIVLGALNDKPGTEGRLFVTQNATGNHKIVLDDNNFGNVDIAYQPGKTSLLQWYRSDDAIYWTAELVTPDVEILNPSTITDFTVDIVNTLSCKVKWSAPMGQPPFTDVASDFYYLVLQNGEIGNNYQSVKVNKVPAIPYTEESMILPNLEPETRYYAALYSEKIVYGQSRLSALSNVITFVTSSQVSPEDQPPKRIPIFTDKIYAPLVHIHYEPGEQFSNYPAFQRLGEQDYLIDNNGVPEGTPTLNPVASYQSYGTLQPDWYNVGSYKCYFEFDGLYDLEYIYVMIPAFNNTRFKFSVSTDGVELFKIFDRNETVISAVDGWTKIPIDTTAAKSVRFLVLELFVGDMVWNGVVPYGRLVQKDVKKGIKWKSIPTNRPFQKYLGTNAFFAELNYDLMGNVSGLTRFYNECVWFMPPEFRDQGQSQSATPDDMRLQLDDSFMWNFTQKIEEMRATGQEIHWETHAGPAFLRPADYSGDASRCKAVDLGLDPFDLTVTTDPQSYKFISRIYFILAAKYGYNPDVDPTHVKLTTGADQLGMGYIRHWEFGNEVDRYWSGQEAFCNPHEVAAYMSAIYDGHKGALGDGYGIINADPSAKLLYPGLVGSNMDFMMESIWWWDKYRGKGDYPCDIINFHHYNMWLQETDAPVWSTVPRYALAPEWPTQEEEFTKAVALRSTLMPQAEVWCSENGYDEQNGGVLSPRDNTQLLRSRHKAVWLLRSFVLGMYWGLDVLQNYWYAGDTVRLEDLNPNNVQREQFYTSGLCDGVTSAQDRNRKPLTSYWYVGTLRNVLEGFQFAHAVMYKGEVLTVETDIIQTVNTTVCAMAFSDGSNSKMMIWNGVQDWSIIPIRLRVASTSGLTINVVDFQYQELRETLEPTVTVYEVKSEGQTKYIELNISEYPLIVETSLIGEKKLIAPLNAEATALSDSAIKITYTDKNLGLNDTRVYMSQSPDSDFVLVAEEYRDNAEITITGLTENTIYYFRLQFIEDGAESDISSVISGITNILLAIPTNLHMSENTASTINVAWDYDLEEQEKITGFEVSRATSPNGTYIAVGNVGAEDREFRDFGLVPSTTYYYKVRAKRDSTTSDFTAVQAMTTKAPNLNPPVPVAATVNSLGTGITISFDEELKDEASAITAFSIVETTEDSQIIMHNNFSIALTSDPTTVSIKTKRPMFKGSSITISYDDTLGALKSIYDVNVETFSNYAVVNNITLNFKPLTDFAQLNGITRSYNNLTVTAGNGDALSNLSIHADDDASLRMGFEVGVSSLLMALDPNPGATFVSDLPSWISKGNENPIWQYAPGETDYSGNSINIGVERALVQLRVIGASIFYEYTVDNGENWITLYQGDRPEGELYVKFIGTINQKAISLSYDNLKLSTNSIYILNFSIPEAENGEIVDRNITVVPNLVGIPTEYQVAETSDMAGADWQSVATGDYSFQYQVSDSFGVKNIYIRYRNPLSTSNIRVQQVNYVNLDVPIVLSSIVINSGANTTYSRDVIVHFEYVGLPTFYKIANAQADLASTPWKAWTSNDVSYQLSTGSGSKTIFAMLRNDETTSLYASDSIVYTEIVKTRKTIVITPNSAITADDVEVSLAPLKYNKDFAWGVTSDDQMIAGWSILFNYFNNFWVDDEINHHINLPRTTGRYPGRVLTYTDGCGVVRRFTVNTANWYNLRTEYWSYPLDEPEPNNSYPFLNWEEVLQMLDFDGDISFHDVQDTAVPDGGASGGTVTQILAGMEDANQYVFNKIGRRMMCLTEPNGDPKYTQAGEIFEDIHLLTRAEDSAQGYNFVNLKSNLNIEKLKVARYFPSDSPDLATFINWFQTNFAATASDTVGMYGELGVHGTDQPLGDGSQPKIAIFDWLYDTHGEAGSDRLWFATNSEVLQYKYLNKYTDVTKEQDGSNILIHLDVPSFPNFNWSEFSVIIGGMDGTDVSNISFVGDTYGLSWGTSKGSLLVNTNYDATLSTRAEKYVALFETSGDVKDQEKAEYFVQRLRTALAAPFTARIQAVINPPTLTSIVINNGTTITNSRIVPVHIEFNGGVSGWAVSFNNSSSFGDWTDIDRVLTETDFDITLPSLNGEYDVYIKTRNDFGESNILSGAITYTADPIVLSTVVINNGAPSTQLTNVSIQVTFTGNPSQYIASEDSAFTGATWQNLAGASSPQSFVFAMSSSLGTKTIYVKLRDDNMESSSISDTIELEAYEGQKAIVAFGNSLRGEPVIQTLPDTRKINYVDLNLFEDFANYSLVDTINAAFGTFVVKPSQYPATGFSLEWMEVFNPTLTGNAGPFPDKYLSKYYSSYVVSDGSKLLARFKFPEGTYKVRIYSCTSKTYDDGIAGCLIGVNGIEEDINYTGQNTIDMTEIDNIPVGSDTLLDITLRNTLGNEYEPGFNLLEIIKKV